MQTQKMQMLEKIKNLEEKLLSSNAALDRKSKSLQDVTSEAAALGKEKGPRSLQAQDSAGF